MNDEEETVGSCVPHDRETVGSRVPRDRETVGRDDPHRALPVKWYQPTFSFAGVANA